MNIHELCTFVLLFVSPSALYVRWCVLLYCEWTQFTGMYSTSYRWIKFCTSKLKAYSLQLLYNYTQLQLYSYWLGQFGHSNTCHLYYNVILIACSRNSNAEINERNQYLNWLFTAVVMAIYAYCIYTVLCTCNNAHVSLAAIFLFIMFTCFFFISIGGRLLCFCFICTCSFSLQKCFT